jgi:hypothetical protein
MALLLLLPTKSRFVRETGKVPCAQMNFGGYRVTRDLIYFLLTIPHKADRLGLASCSKGESEELDFGHKEGNFLAFTLRLRQPDGQRVKTFFVGKMQKHEIVGSFVDDSGITGEWTAVPASNSAKSRKVVANRTSRSQYQMIFGFVSIATDVAKCRGLL